MSAYRKMLLSLLGGKCSLCDSTENLELHHKDGNRSNNDVRNIQLLCRGCHRVKFHGRKKENRGYKVFINFTDEQWRLLEKFRGIYGRSDSEIVKYIVMSYLSEKTYIKDEIEKT